ncbi:DNA/RNA-binding protein KIN17 [Tupaia chinensis]|uniref:DNA/RNA-binding protein KIN17 n=1 Tax=Tupaia chinensis TaxID=246437 RepID=L9JE82_TUPCH|nr:DNA/RNA-binding protein KIN17 [Tupaia chinensis]
MGKSNFLIPKAITNRIKSRGLRKLRWRYSGTRRAHDNTVYNEHIRHLERTHEPTQRLGREGVCKVDGTRKGWYFQDTSGNPETICQQLETEKRQKQDLDDEEETAEFFQEQGRRDLEGKEQKAPFMELSREDDEEKVMFNLDRGACSAAGSTPSESSSLDQAH